VKTTVEKLSPTRVKLTLAVTPDELKPSIDHAYGHIAESITIPGFRKGKVPAPIIDQRVGREEVLNHAVNDALDKFYRQAVDEQKIRPLGRPEADITGLPAVKDFTGDLIVTVEVDVRPEFTLPSIEGIELTVDAVEVTDDEVEAELQGLLTRFGTLITVDRPAKTGDFAQLDLVAQIDGIDEALDSLSAGETTTFESKLLGGDNEGETAQITVTLLAVKERELPAADDDFAQIASQFDTIDELKADIREQVGRSKVFGQGTQARDQVVDKLLESVEIPVPEQLVLDEVHRHLENESRLEDEAHRAEVTESSEKTFRSQILLDVVAEKEEIKVSQDELTQYLIQGAAQYNMEPGEFIKVLDQNGQIPGMIGEIARGKALAIVLSKAKVLDSNGQPVDLTSFTASVTDDSDEDFVEASVGSQSNDGHSHGGAKDSHGRSAGNEHYGHDHK
jgi:trigger factor